MKHTDITSAHSSLLTIALIALCALWALSAPQMASATPDQLWEDYVLSENVEEWLESLPVGSENRLYLEVLHAQANGALSTADQLIKNAESAGVLPWRVASLKTRQLLLTLSEHHSDSAWGEIIKSSRVTLSNTPYHPPPRGDQSKTTIDQSKRSKDNRVTLKELDELIEARVKEALPSLPDLTIEGVTHTLKAQHRLGAPQYKEEHLRQLISRLSSAPAEGVIQLFQKIPSKYWPGLSIFPHLSDQQLETLLHTPDLTQTVYDSLLNALMTRLSRVKETSFDPYQLSVKDFKLYHDRFTSLIPLLKERHHSFKAHLLLAQLVASERRGEWPKGALIKYLKLPQDYSHYNQVYQASLTHTTQALGEPSVDRYAHPNWIEGAQIQRYRSLTGFRLDEPPSVVVARHIEHHLKTRRDTRIFKTYLDASLLYKMWAKSHILTGKSLKSEALSKYLKSDDYTLLTQLKRLSFTPYVQRLFKRDQEVSLRLEVKGYDALQIKIYMLNTLAYLTTHHKSVPLGIDLSGLQANYSKTMQLSDQKERMQTPTLTLSELTAPGTYIVDIQAGDEKMRAMIQRGSLSPYIIDSTSGPELIVIDDLGHIAKDVEVSLDGRAYTAEESGRVRLPYANRQHSGRLLMTQGDLSVMSTLSLPMESYQLELSVAAPQLRGGDRTPLRMRARLTLNRTPLPLTLLKELSLNVKVSGADGTPQSQKIPHPTFDQAGELTQPIELPLGFKKLNVTLEGTLKSITQGKELKLKSQPVSFDRNADLTSVNVGDVIFAQGASPPYLQVIGRSGEAIANQVVTLSIAHTRFQRAFTLSKRTDARGRVTLPQDLGDYSNLSAQITSEKSDRVRFHEWALRQSSEFNTIKEITVREGETLRFMWSGSKDVYLVNTYTQRVIEDGVDVEHKIAQVQALEPGHYELIDVVAQRRIPLRVFTRSDLLKDGLWFTSRGVYPYSPPSQQVFEPVMVVDDQVTVKIDHARPHTRLHIIATPFALDQDLVEVFAPLEPKMRPSVTFQHPLSAYGVGQVLSEEMRYILKRQASGGHVGNLAPSPSLLVNRFDQGVASSEDRPMLGGLGLRGYGSGGGGSASGMGYGRGRLSRKKKSRSRMGRIDRFSSLIIDDSLRSWDFLSVGAALKWAISISSSGSTRAPNSAPTPTGKDKEPSTQTLVFPLSTFAGMGRLHLVLTDGIETSHRTLSLPPSPPSTDRVIARKDLRAAPSLQHAQKMNVMKREQRGLSKGSSIVLPDLSSQWESYETLESVYTLFERLLPRSRLNQLRELLSWPSLTDQEKYDLYGALGSHEADLFLYHKDPAFFKTVIAPLIAQKGTRSFLERWMLGEDLSGDLDLHRFNALNLFERILLLKSTARSPDDQAKLLRYARQHLDARPVSRSRLQSLFNAAIAPSLDSGNRSKGASLNENEGSSPLEEEEEQGVLRAFDDEVKPAAVVIGAAAPPPSAPKVLSTSTNKLKKRREKAPRLYQGEDDTHQWIERRYFGQTVPNPSMISINRFWLDFAQHDPKSGPFLSPHFPEAATNINAAWIALALLDLPFTATRPNMSVDQGQLTLSAQSSGLYFYEGSVEQVLPETQSVSIRREYWSLKRSRQLEESAPKEYRVGIPYATKLMIMNPTAQEVEYELSHPIPDGAMMLISDQNQRIISTRHIKLKPHEIKVTGYSFYFPKVGRYKHAPAYVTQEGRLIGASAVSTLKVVEELTQLNQESWTDVARLGTHEEVLTFLRRHNPLEINLRLIDQRLPDAQFYHPLIELLSERRIFDHTIWSYALAHHDLKRAHTFFSLTTHLREIIGPYIELKRAEGHPLILDRFEQLIEQHYDFDPLTVSRAHSRGKVDAITHPELKKRYLTLLKYLAHKRRVAWTLHDWLGLTYYLVKQGRLDDALRGLRGADRVARSSKISAEAKLHYDYLTSYLNISQGKVEQAQRIAERYRDLKHPEWRDRFNELLSPPDLGLSLHQGLNDQKSATDPSLSQSLDFKIEGEQLVIDSHQISAVHVSLYPIDLEVLFSNNPTALEGGAITVSPLVKPSFEKTLEVNAEGATLFSIPKEWNKRALQVEVKSGSTSQIRSYSPQSFKQLIFKERGLLRVINSGESASSISGAYVKVYVKLKSGEVRFHKDGYTDYRGVFDYVNANPAPALSTIDQLLIMTLTKDHGATIRTVGPPAH